MGTVETYCFSLQELFANQDSLVVLIKVQAICNDNLQCVTFNQILSSSISMNSPGKIIVVNVTVIQDIWDKDTITSDETLLWHRWICHCFISQAICVLGTVTNILNIVCFIKLGFQDPVNVTLVGMSMHVFISVLLILPFRHDLCRHYRHYLCKASITTLVTLFL